MLPASTFQLTEPLSVLCSKGEKALGLEVVCMYCVCVHACVYYILLDYKIAPVVLFNGYP